MTKILKYDKNLGVRTRTFVDDLEAMRQKIFIRLSIHRGSWDWDVTVGLPWEEWLEQKPFPLEDAREEIAREISRTSSNLTVSDAGADFDEVTQTASFNYNVRTAEDEILGVQVGVQDGGLSRVSLSLFPTGII